jgi:hypothetical protein
MMENGKKKRPTYDWGEIEMEYVTDPSQTYETLSKKYGPRLQAISKHAQAGRWREKRSAFRERSQQKVREELATRAAKETADEIEKMNKAHYDSQAGLKYLADKKVIADVDKVKSGQSGELTIGQIHALANTHKTVQESQRTAKGLSDKDLNVNLVYKQLTPLLEKITTIIEEHAPQAREAIIREFTALFGTDAA